MGSFFDWASKGVIDYVTTRERRVDAIGSLIKQGDKEKASSELDWAKKSIKKVFNNAFGETPEKLNNFANTPSDKNQRSQLKEAKYWLKIVTDDRDETVNRKRFMSMVNKPYRRGEPIEVTRARNLLGLADLADGNVDSIEYVEFDDED